MLEKVELVIVGAGPAGIEAAITAAEAGTEVMIIDSYPKAGGQYFKQIPAAFRSKAATSTQREGEMLFRLLDGLKIKRLYNTLVWGAFPAPVGDGWQLALYGPDAPKKVNAKSLVIASGAYDFPVAFPGWTLPGVITAGAAQILIKNQRVFPGKRTLVSGTGPLQLAVAAELIHAGVEVAAVLEASNLILEGIKNSPALWGQWGRMIEGWDYGTSMLKARTPYRMGWSVIEARGDDRVEEAVIAKLDKDWKPIPGSQQTISVDTIVSGYGLIPNTGLIRMLGCKMIAKSGQVCKVPERDETMQTSLPGVFVVGDAAGIGGAEMARLEGRTAGLAAALRSGRMDEAQVNSAYRRIKPALRRQQRFAEFLGKAFFPKQGLISLATEDTILCRCEEVTLTKVREAIAMGARTITEVKMLTRTGMGNCQGRVCEQNIARMIVHLLADPEVTLETVGSYSIRPPLHPLPVSVLAESAEIEPEQF